MKKWHYFAIAIGAWFLYYTITEYWKYDVSIWRFYAAGMVLYFAGWFHGERKDYW